MVRVSDSNQLEIQPPESSSDMNMASRDIYYMENVVRKIGLNVSTLNYQKSRAMSLTEFYECSKKIRREKDKLVTALLQYKRIEQDQDLPVNLEYRSILKKLLK